ncbi:hypothetical protein B0T26DRAFT_843279 [Lasiosphaeria miniovina]|uniref:CFEM domain-containing protein n=1 Tax=Lasiosphaeria miniovina TaxID=1954250 RepID=A0AA40BGB1_9PEZI|nr:uncharacterized protein B0T26DRAFT_843279 [Lasiosphaeria miniovina]KAK0733722.1 hypothetical protein B0T26DRAFT_843279 [Lasiosphaeria miniovina]
MKAALALVAATVGAVLAQDLSGQPTCATACLISAISAAGCGPSDMACQCGPTQTAIVNNVVPCLLASCTSGTDILQASSAGEARCSSFLATAATTTPASTTSAATTAGPTSVPTSVGTISQTSFFPGSNTTITTPTLSNTPTPTPSTTSTKSTSTNAAATPVALGAGVVLGFLGLIAAL